MRSIPGACVFLTMFLLLHEVPIDAVTDDCSSNPTGAFLPESTFSAQFTTLCENTDGRKGGCTTANTCNTRGGSATTDAACTGSGQKCCLFDNKFTKISNRTCYCMLPKYCTGATFSGLCPGSASAKCCADETSQLASCPASPAVSLANFKTVYSSLSDQRATALWPYINTALDEIASPATCHIKSSLLAQIHIETLGLLWTEESASGEAYEGRASLGNTQTGDGPRFKGRGLLQLTGRNNYNAYKTSSGEDVLDDPEKVAFQYLATKSSAWFWTSNSLSQYADGTLLGFHRLVAKINGPGMNHLTERVDKWRSVSQTLGCDVIKDGVGDDCDGGKGSCVVDSTCKTEIIAKCGGKACCPRDPKTVKCCKKGNVTTEETTPAATPPTTPPTQNGGSDCDGGWGTCVVDTTCSTEIKPQCNGKACCPNDPNNVKCCRKSNDCADGWGTCVVDTTCSTEIKPQCNGKACCPNDPNNVKCCRKGTSPPSAAPLGECVEKGRRGDCEFYVCANEHFGCGDADYFLAYGYRYCTRFSTHYNSFDEQGRAWVDAVRKCLMQKILNVYSLRMSCDDLKTFAFDSHPDCYVNSADGFCRIFNVKNSIAFWKVFQFKDFMGDDGDLSKQQIKQTLKSCYCEVDDVTTINDVISKMDIDEFTHQTIPAASGEFDEALASQLADRGDCQFFSLFERRFPCSSWRHASHVDDFERVLCERYHDNRALFLDEGRRWIVSARLCIMKAMLPLYRQTSVQCTDLLEQVFKLREDCYTQNNFCAFEAAGDHQFALYEVTSWSLGQVFTYFGKAMDLYKQHLKFLRCRCHGRAITKYRIIESESGVKMKLRGSID